MTIQVDSSRVGGFAYEKSAPWEKVSGPHYRLTVSLSKREWEEVVHMLDGTMKTMPGVCLLDSIHALLTQKDREFSMASS